MIEGNYWQNKLLNYTAIILEIRQGRREIRYIKIDDATQYDKDRLKFKPFYPRCRYCKNMSLEHLDCEHQFETISFKRYGGRLCLWIL